MRVKLIAFAVVTLVLGLGVVMSFTGHMPYIGDRTVNKTVNGSSGYATAESTSTVKTERVTEFIREEVSVLHGGSDKRYINKYESVGEPRNWILEEGNVSLDELENMRFPIYEVTRYPDTEPTVEDINSSWEFYNRTYEVIKRNGWFEYKNAIEEGYVDHILSDGLHHYNLSYSVDGESLNPKRPESLVYYDNPKEENDKILAGVMYQNIKQEGFQFGGPLTVWHYHPTKHRKIEHGEDALSQETEFGSFNQVMNKFYKEVPKRRLKRTGEMIHVWFIDHPEGPFGTSMSVPQDALDEPEKMNKEEFRRQIIEAYEKRSGR